MLINALQSDILEHLGYFGYLTVSQIQRLTGKSLGYIRQVMAILVQRKYIASFHIEVATKRTENMYTLTKEGKALLQQHEKVFPIIRTPIGNPIIVRDFTHRKNYTDFVISVVLFLRSKGIAIPLFLSYFDFVGDNRTQKNGALQSRTKIPLDENAAFAPDGVIITDHNSKQTLLLLEMYNGRDTIRVVNQLYHKHAIAISKGTPGTTFNIPANPFVFSCFEFDGCKKAVIKRLLQDSGFTAMSNLFFFASLDDVIQDFPTAWHTIHGEPFLIDRLQ